MPENVSLAEQKCVLICIVPSRNVLKVDVPDSYYHVYARGASKEDIFLDEDDFYYFQHLLFRYLSHQEVINSSRTPYEKLYNKVELLSFAQMKNHFHLLLYQIEQGAMRRLMHGVMTAYVIYFNKKYDKTGSLFENRYKASKIDNDGYLEHITRYIHLNPSNWRNYPYSTISNYVDSKAQDWVKPERILTLFRNEKDYLRFVADYQESKNILSEIKHLLADDGINY